jgi:hypothetical protein
MFLVVGISLVVICAIAVGATAAAIYRAGAIIVDVESNEGMELSVRVPAGLADVAIALVPAEPLREFADELQLWTAELEPWWPAVRTSYRELAEAPDFVLVEVSGTEERLVVRKRGTRLVIDFSSDGERVHVVVPLRTVERALNKLERGLLAS